jgi:glycoside/pentoside/hexuronide:cation symporter, GPH family
VVSRMGKRNAMLGALALAIISRIIVIFAPTNLIVLAVTSAMLGISIGFSNLYATMMADTVDYGEWKRGKRIEGMTSAVGGFFIKLAMAGASGAIGWVLQARGYDASLAAQPEGAINALFFIIIWMPIIVFVISTILLLFYDLDKTLPKMHTEMEERRAQIAGPVQ